MIDKNEYKNLFIFTFPPIIVYCVQYFLMKTTGFFDLEIDNLTKEVKYNKKDSVFVWVFITEMGDETNSNDGRDPNL